jgi:hypothetical protein
MIITLISPGKVKNKRFTAIMENGDEISFGLSGGKTYIDHKDKTKRLNYWRRHYARDIEKKLIKHLVPSPALFSAMLLWGQSTDLNRNIEVLNDMLKLKNK